MPQSLLKLFQPAYLASPVPVETETKAPAQLFPLLPPDRPWHFMLWPPKGAVLLPHGSCEKQRIFNGNLLI